MPICEDPSQHTTFPTDEPLQSEDAGDTSHSESTALSVDTRKPGLSEALIHLNAENAEDILRTTVQADRDSQFAFGPQWHCPTQPNRTSQLRNDDALVGTRKIGI